MENKMKTIFSVNGQRETESYIRKERTELIEKSARRFMDRHNIGYDVSELEFGSFELTLTYALSAKHDNYLWSLWKKCFDRAINSIS